MCICLILCLAGALAARWLPFYSCWVRFSLGIATLLLALSVSLYLLCIHKKEDNPTMRSLENNKEWALTITTVLGVLLVGITFWIPDMWGFAWPEVTANSDLLDYYSAQLSLTFISISVMSVLSDHSVIIYWENVAQRKLIRPVFGSFAAFTAYSIGATVGAGISVVLNHTLAFYVFFVINILTLILLTLTMVDVYYNRSKKKDRLRKELVTISEAYVKFVQEKERDPWPNEEKLDLFAREEKNLPYRDAYQDRMLKLKQHVLQAADEHNLVYLREIRELVKDHLSLFKTPEGRKVLQQLLKSDWDFMFPVFFQVARDSIEANRDVQINSPVAKTASRKTCLEITDFQVDDLVIWQLLAESEEFAQWVCSGPSDFIHRKDLFDFIYLFCLRLAVFYNELAAYCNSSSDKIPVIPFIRVVESYHVAKTSFVGGEEITASQWKAMLDELTIPMISECGYSGSILCRLMDVFVIMLQNMHPYHVDTLKTYLEPVEPLIRWIIENGDFLDGYEDIFGLDVLRKHYPKKD